ncbi:MAG: hypothetical protein KDI33_05155 [Halioglobus sp.]|nr:hypothetical protein [Halioglobus sp.]
MTLSDLANIGETFGGLAVLVSLIYLILEVRRNTRTAKSTAAWNATVALGELCEGMSQDRELSTLVIRASTEDCRFEDLSEEEIAQYFMFFRSVFFKYEAQWYLWRDGTLSDEMWQNRRRWAKSFVSLPVPARMWEIEKNQHQYAPGLFESIDSAIATSLPHIFEKRE